MRTAEESTRAESPSQARASTTRRGGRQRQRASCEAGSTRRKAPPGRSRWLAEALCPTAFGLRSGAAWAVEIALCHSDTLARQPGAVKPAVRGRRMLCVVDNGSSRCLGVGRWGARGGSTFLASSGRGRSTGRGRGGGVVRKVERRRFTAQGCAQVWQPQVVWEPRRRRYEGKVTSLSPRLASPRLASSPRSSLLLSCLSLPSISCLPPPSLRSHAGEHAPPRCVGSRQVRAARRRRRGRDHPAGRQRRRGRHRPPPRCSTQRRRASVAAPSRESSCE